MADRLSGIEFEQLEGGLGRTLDTSDRVFLLTSANAVGSDFALNTTYTITSLNDAASRLKLSESNNGKLYRAILQYYSIVGSGNILYIFGVSPQADHSLILSTDTSNPRSGFLSGHFRNSAVSSHL